MPVHRESLDQETIRQIFQLGISKVGLDRAKAGGRNSVTQRFKKDTSIKDSNLLKMPNFEKH